MGLDKRSSRRELSFTHHEGRTSDVKIKSEEVIAESERSNIVRSMVRIGDRERVLVFKRFFDNEESGTTAREFAENSFKAYSRLKELGIPTWTTYRLEKERPWILMSDGENDGTLIVGYNSSDSLDRLVDLEPEAILNLSQTVERVIAESIIPASKGLVYLNYDCWLARVSLIEDKKAITFEPFIADLDIVETNIDGVLEDAKTWKRKDPTRPSPASPEKDKFEWVLKQNLATLSRFFHSSLREYMTPNTVARYLESIDEITSFDRVRRSIAS